MFCPDMSYSEYERAKGLRFSDLAAFLSGYRKPDSPAFAFGRLVHSLVLMPDTVTDETEHEISKAPRADYILACSIRDAWHAKEENRDLLNPAFLESSLFTKDQGVDLKSRLDIFAPGLVADLKTTHSLDTFLVDAEAYGYYRQMAWYVAAAEAVTGEKFPNVILAAVEKRAPYRSALFEISSRDIETARYQNAINLALYRRHLAEGQKPQGVEL